MATQKQSRNRRLNMAERAKQQMDIQFPGHPDALLWHRKLNDGYSTIPRTLPLAMQAIDAGLSQSRTVRASSRSLGRCQRNRQQPTMDASGIA